MFVEIALAGGATAARFVISVTLQQAPSTSLRLEQASFLTRNALLRIWKSIFAPKHAHTCNTCTHGHHRQVICVEEAKPFKHKLESPEFSLSPTRLCSIVQVLTLFACQL
jgi:hypothetical protein